jgi:dihydroorotase
MEMPNTVPNATNHNLLEEKYVIASQKSLANYSFYLGASNDNLEEVLKTDQQKVCGVKVFMGSSTGNMLVDNENSLRKIFSRSPILIATHCEDESIIRENTRIFRDKYGENPPIELHPIIRSEEACYHSSHLAVSLAEEYGTRLHVLHISTARELDLFNKNTSLADKKITTEATIHHLWFQKEDYKEKGTLIKWNPAIKNLSDREALRQGVKEDLLDVIATDHAPHTLEEKSNSYFKAPSGGPLIQYGLAAMLELYHQGVFSLETIVQKMAHNPATIFQIEKRGFINEGYFADLVIVNPDIPTIVDKDSILSKCGWSPFEGLTFKSSIQNTIVSGSLVYVNGRILESGLGKRLTFAR